MRQNNIDEPWYHFVSIGHEEARNHVFKIFQHKYEDHEELKKVIKEVVNDKVEMGSVRGYWSFQHNEFKLRVQERLDYINRKIK
tara:strand:+ start:472 stop:723 length:252 start_codon:yes stop_codon:yes gene_type:complete